MKDHLFVLLVDLLDLLVKLGQPLRLQPTHKKTPRQAPFDSPAVVRGRGRGQGVGVGTYMRLFRRLFRKDSDEVFDLLCFPNEIC